MPSVLGTKKGCVGLEASKGASRGVRKCVADEAFGGGGARRDGGGDGGFDTRDQLRAALENPFVKPLGESALSAVVNGSCGAAKSLGVSGIIGKLLSHD
mmetsp:Transcript_22768/g.49139  ORF Transcript_22768/g.49139 Transcript_22768/m.49139 type:complete len:99 (-) Transcript_22768:69-365(-)